MELIPIQQIPRMEQPRLWKYTQIYQMVAKAINAKASVLISYQEIADLGRSPVQLLNSLHAWGRQRGLKIVSRRKTEGLYLFPMWRGDFYKKKEELEWLKLSRRDLKKVKRLLKANPEV